MRLKPREQQALSDELNLRDPVVRFALLNRAALDEIGRLVSSANGERRVRAGERNRVVKLFGGIDQVKVLLDLAKENRIGFEFIGMNDDGIGADLVLRVKGSATSLIVEAKPYPTAAQLAAIAEGDFIGANSMSVNWT